MKRLILAAAVFVIGAACLGQTHAWVHAAPTLRYGAVAVLAVISIALAVVLISRPRNQQQTRQPRARTGRQWQR